jgi:hypothetical protein
MNNSAEIGPATLDLYLTYIYIQKHNVYFILHTDWVEVILELWGACKNLVSP